jgi:hypothetical protein
MNALFQQCKYIGTFDFCEWCKSCLESIIFAWVGYLTPVWLCDDVITGDPPHGFVDWVSGYWLGIPPQSQGNFCAQKLKVTVVIV